MDVYEGKTRFQVLLILRFLVARNTPEIGALNSFELLIRFPLYKNTRILAVSGHCMGHLANIKHWTKRKLKVPNY